MEQSQPEPVSPYQDPALIEAAGGDSGLLERLAALEIAKRNALQNPNEPALQRLPEVMAAEVETYKREAGLINPRPTDH